MCAGIRGACPAPPLGSPWSRGGGKEAFAGFQNNLKPPCTGHHHVAGPGPATSREASSLPEWHAPDLCPSPRPQQDDDDREVDAGSLAGPRGAPAPKHRSRLATRFPVTAHWLLVAAGRTLAIVLLALAGTRWARSRGPSTDRHAGRGLSCPAAETAITRPGQAGP